MLVKTKTKIESEIIKQKFTISLDFRDPLIPLKAELPNISEEIEIEEISSYYNIHLGIPMHIN